MKLLPINTQKRVNTQDSLGHGMDAVIMLAIFLLAGFGLDRLFGTMPVFMIVMTVIGSVGLFYKFKYRYSARMDELDAQRRDRQTARTVDTAAGTAPHVPSMPITPGAKVPSSIVPSSFRRAGSAPAHGDQTADAEESA